MGCCNSSEISNAEKKLDQTDINPLQKGNANETQKNKSGSIHNTKEMINTNYEVKNNTHSSEEQNNDNIYSLLLPIIGGNKNKKYIDDALNNITNKNDIEQICYFLINKEVPSSTGYIFLFNVFIGLFFVYHFNFFLYFCLNTRFLSDSFL